jgi:predicted ABC-type transport system involved in lysophospholipase L1 biosynthesis ATPase subunit
MSDGPILAAEGVERRYATGRRVLEVLRGVDLDVREGEALAITGMSGAGKSTLLHILGGLDRPDAGRVAFAGRDWYAMGERERGRVRAKQVGFVFQAYHLLPEMSVLENVMLAGMNQPGAVWRGRALRARAVELLGQVGLEARMTHRPNELSGGEQQRVALARALVNHPILLLADEPTGNLDSKTGEDVLACLFDLRKREGLTLVMVTHNEDIAERCGRRIRMRDGRIEDESGQKTGTT